MKKIIMILILLLSLNSVKALEQDEKKFTIIFYDDLTKSTINSGYLSFEKTALEVYKDNFPLGITNVGKDGIYEFKTSEMGNYKLVYYMTSDGYEKMKEVYEFKIDANYQNITKKVYLKPIQKKVKVEKYYGNSKLGTKYRMKDVIFNVFDSKNKLVEQLKTKELGYAETKLIYGEYKIVEEKNPNNFKEIKKVYFSYPTVGSLNLFEEKYEAKLKINLYETGTTTPIRNVKFIINHKEYITDEKGSFITETLDEGMYLLEEEFVKNYYKNDNITIQINEESKIYLENNEPYLNVILYNEKIAISEKDNNKEVEGNKNNSGNEESKENNIEIPKKEEKNLEYKEKEDNLIKEDIVNESDIYKLPYLSTKEYIYYYLYYLALVIGLICVKKIST